MERRRFPWKTVDKGLRDGADNLDEQTQQCWSLAQRCTLGRADQRRNTQRKLKRDSCPYPRAARCMLKRLCKDCSKAPRAQLEFSISRNTE